MFLVNLLKKLFKNSFKLKFVKYSLIGVMNTMICGCSMFVLSIIGFNYIFYYILGYTIAIINSYLMNSFWTFDFKKKSFMHFIIFFSINIVFVIISEFLVYVLIEHVNYSEFISVLIGITSFTITMFFVNDKFIFSR